MPLVAQTPQLPEAPFPLGKADLPETRTITPLSPGVTHLHVERGRKPTGRGWALESRSMTDKSEVATLRDRLREAGLRRVDEHWFKSPSDGEPYCVLLAGEFDTKLDARRALLGLSFREVLQVRNRAGLDDWDGGPWMLDLVIVDPKHFHGKIVAAREERSIRPSEFARKRGALVAINASLFHFSLDDLDGVPAGTAIMQGEWYNEPNGGSILFIENTPEGPRLSISYDPPPVPVIEWASGKTAPLNGIGRMPRGDEITVLRPEIFATSQLSHFLPEGVLAAQVWEDGRLIPIVSASHWDPRSLVLLARGKGRTLLEQTITSGERMKPVDLRVPGRPGLNAAYGIPVLIRDGQPNVVQVGRPYHRTSRTAMGADAGGRVYILTVDGDAYDPPADGRLGSVGASYAELTAIFQHLGAINAIHLDSGGSTTMAINGEVANHPYNVQFEHGDGIERPVPDSILVID
ncbi:hypothetical protein AXK11_01350 [Cephaloticoccus primus]|uniref:Phosphodiester glycosidase domain-containing protein n=2 Tax=Cephaloticoccus primus TaxID=1548207 RepID=A0A139SUJ9_9BACT|nr:hypothetical protein AXK11_01350 [Cephaloticoccus primus]